LLIKSHKLFNLASQNFILKNSNLRPENPLVTIILVTYNHKNYIKECLNGLLMQSVNFVIECLVSDDCSDDGTSEIISELENENKNLIFHVSRTHRLGQYTGNGRFSFLHTLSLSGGKYIAFINGDDYWTDPYKLQKQVDYLEANPECSICTHWVEEKNETNKSIVINKSNYNGNDNTDRFDKNTVFTYNNLISFHSSSFMFRKECISSFMSMPISVAQGDSWILMSCLTMGYGFCIQEKMSVYRVNESSIWTPQKTIYRFLNSLHLLVRLGFWYPQVYGIQAFRKIISALNNFSLSEMKAYEPEDYINSINALKSKDPIFSKLLEVLLFTKMLLESFQRKLSKVRILIGSKI
jgi:glycosyltransferase involved in cell wall biosynthesis